MKANSSSASVIDQFRNDPAFSMYSHQVLDTSHADYHKTASIGATDDTVTVFDNLLEKVNFTEGKLGALCNQLLHAMNSMSVTLTNTEASRSTILETDYAQTTSELARVQILQQVATAMLAKATSAPEALLPLVKRE